jgi:glyoxylase-like metal-dependent hydrolase (beta-lactamase superfamily II)
MSVRAESRRLTAPLPGGAGEGATVSVEPLLAGRMYAPRAFFEAADRFTTLRMLGIGTSRSNWWAVPIPAFLIHHPTAGPFLVDTGLHPSVASKPQENLGRMYSNFGRPELRPGQDLPAQLRARDIDPKSIRLVVMTHLHLDHASGMSEFPAATFVLTEEEWVAATTDRRPFLRGYRPSHYDYAFDYRTLSYSGEAITSYSSFGRTFDLFGDGSVRLAFTPGHSAGHQSVICRLSDRDLVIAGDAIYTMAQLEGGPEPPRPLDRHNWRRSMRELQLFRKQYPQAVIVPGHDPFHWELVKKRYE